jgi:high-affinity K+ transport system ATPase subunit B
MTGKMAANPAPAMADGSVTPAMYTAIQAAKKERTHEAANALISVISSSPSHIPYHPF